jgi:hypothetical protein
MSEAIQQQVEEGVVPSEHEQAMIDLVDNTEAASQGQADPESAPEYVEETKEPEIDYKAEYEKLKASSDSTQPPADEGLTIEPDKEEPESEHTDSVTSLTPEELGKYTEEFSKSGELSEESYTELKALGVSKDLVDNYIQGQAAVQEARDNAVYESVGGKEAYSDMIAWAKESWTPEQINVFNDSVNSSDSAKVSFGVESLTAQYKAAQGSPVAKRALKGSGGSVGTSGGNNSFETKTDMMKAMRHPSYGKDASYTKMVERKVGNSTFL